MMVMKISGILLVRVCHLITEMETRLNIKAQHVVGVVVVMGVCLNWCVVMFRVGVLQRNFKMLFLFLHSVIVF